MSALGSITDPDLRSILLDFKQEVGFGLNCHQLGKIQSFDTTTQTATVLITAKRVVFNKTQALNSGLQLSPSIIDYPVLVDVPVFVLFGGGARLTLPIAAGDTCLVLFNDRDIDNWFTTGTAQPPNSARAHSLADGLALVGFRHLQNKFTSYNATDAELSLAGGKIKVKANGNLDLLSVNAGEIQIEDKIGILNATTSLKTVLDNLCTALTSWVDTRGDTPNGATITAINAVKTLADALLK